MKSLTYFSLLLACFLSTALAEKRLLDRAELKFSLIPDLSRVPLGEPTFLSFEVKNNSDREVQVTVGGDYRSRLHKPEDFKVSVVDERGDTVPQINLADAEGDMAFEQGIPPSSTYQFRLFLPHWAVFKRPGVYQVRVARLLPSGEAAVDFGAPAYSVDPCASAKIEILPANRKRLGKLIDTLGERILRLRTSSSVSIETKEREAFKAYMMLDSIRDERVIPHYLKLLHSDGYTFKHMAVRSLGRFNDDRALKGLKEAMLTKGADISDRGNPEDGERLADEIRRVAAVGLREGPHPEGVPFLLLQREDRSSAVRLEVVRAAAAKLKPEAAIPLLEKMTHDPDELVREEAARCLDALQPQ